MEEKIYPRSNDKQTVYLKNVITNPNIKIGDYTMYNDFVNDPKGFEQNNGFNKYMKKTEIVAAKLFNDAGIIGAAML